MGVSTINISWEWILGIAFTLSLAFLGWIFKQVADLKKESEARMRFLENENSSKTAKIELLEKIVLKPFEKGEELK